MLTPPPKRGLETWVIGWTLVAGAAGLALAGILLLAPMAGDPRVYADIRTDGLVIAPDSALNIVDWFPGADDAAGAGRRFRGIELGATTIGTAYRGLTNEILADPTFADSAGGFLPALLVDGPCEVRIERVGPYVQFTVTRSRQERRGRLMDVLVRLRLVRARAEGGCRVSGELAYEPDLTWADVVARDSLDGAKTFPLDSLVLGPAESSRIRFALDGSLRSGRFGIRGLSFRARSPGRTVSFIRDGVLRLSDFSSDGEDMVYRGQLPLGRGHPLTLGADVELGDLNEAELLRLNIDQAIHVVMSGKASAPAIDGREIEPRLLQQLNESHELVWMLAFALGAMALALSLIEAAR